jgi:hypothetical protein
VTAARRLEESFFRVESLGGALAAGVTRLGLADLGAVAAAGVAGFGAAAAACLLVSNRRFHISNEGSCRRSRRRQAIRCWVQMDPNPLGLVCLTRLLCLTIDF